MTAFNKPILRWVKIVVTAALIVAGLLAAYATVALAYPELFANKEACCCPEC